MIRTRLIEERQVVNQASAALVCVAIPAFNEEQVIGDVIRAVRAQGPYPVIVVDDGSADRTFEVAQGAGAYCLRHRINRGKGAAAKTAIAGARLFGAEVIVTMDGDGQHLAEDIPALVEPILKGDYDVVLGTRLFEKGQAPWHKHYQNRVANVITWMMTGLRVRDSQSGFRVYGPRAIGLINTRSDTYEYETEVIQEIAHHRLRFAEIPITTRYTAHSTNKAHRQSITNGMITMYKLLWNKLL